MSETRRNKSLDALVQDDATPEMLVELLPKAQGTLKASASYLALVRRAMDSKTKQEQLQRWGDNGPITEVVYDTASLAQRTLDEGLHADPEVQMAALGRRRLSDGHGFTDTSMYENNESGFVDKPVVNEEDEFDFDRYARLIGARYLSKCKPEEAA